MAENKITRYPGILDYDMNKELYLIPEQEITEDECEVIKEYLGVTGPGRQVIEKNGGFYLKSDEAPTAALARVKAEVAEKGGEWPEPEPEPDLGE